MRILSRGVLRDFWKRHPDAEQHLKSWFAEARKAKWKNPHGIIEQYKSASILKGGRVVFNICGNRYRLVVMINYDAQTVYLRFIGTDREYDRINAERI